MSKMELGEKIRSLRKAAGLRQEDLCAKAGVSIRVVKDVESGSGNPTIDNLSLILSVLNVDFYSLISGIPTVMAPAKPLQKDEIAKRLEAIESKLDQKSGPSMDPDLKELFRLITALKPDDRTLLKDNVIDLLEASLDDEELRTLLRTK